MEKKFKNLGFEMIAAPLVTYVEGKMNDMQLKAGELEKAKSWAQEVAERSQNRIPIFGAPCFRY